MSPNNTSNRCTKRINPLRVCNAYIAEAHAGQTASENMRVAHLTTVDLSLRYLVLPQMTGVVTIGGDAIGISADGPHVREIEDLGIRHIALTGATRSINPRSDLTAMVALWTILRRERPDVLHTHTPKPGIYGRIIGRLAGVPAVLNTVHGLYATPDDAFAKRAVVYALEALAARFSDRELIQSAEDFRLVTEHRITRPGRTELLGNGVDLERFRPDEGSTGERNVTREQLGIAPDKIVVGTVGRLVEEKGFIELFDAAHRLDDRFVLVVIGPYEPDKQDALDTDVVADARAAGIQFLGMRNDVDALYRAMDLFVLPSHREGFPRAAMEAAATGLPLVVTDIRGCREVVESNVNGLLVAVRDVPGLAAAITHLGDDPALRSEMGRAGRQKALLEFDERRIVDHVIRAQIRVLREKRRFERFDAGPVDIRRAVAADVDIIAQIHLEQSAGCRRSGRYVGRRIRRLTEAEDGVVWVADDGYGPIAYIAGVAGSGPAGRSATEPGARFACCAASQRSSRGTPRTTKRRSTAGTTGPGCRAEVLSIGIADAYSDAGVGAALVDAFANSASAAGADEIGMVARLADHNMLDFLIGVGFARSASPDRSNESYLWMQMHG